MTRFPFLALVCAATTLSCEATYEGDLLNVNLRYDATGDRNDGTVDNLNDSATDSSDSSTIDSGIVDPCSIDTDRDGLADCVDLCPNEQGVWTNGCPVDECTPTSSDDICNGLDDNCNGSIDEGKDEICDGEDNNCDGEIDEGFFIGKACNVGLGACLRSGVLECDGDDQIRCSVQPAGPGPELCDGIDNDCDGRIDNGLGLGNRCVGVGRCADGRWECSSTHQVVCDTLPGGSHYSGSFELCNGLDDDCNGIVDDNYISYLGQACGGSCGQGVMECMPDGSYMTCSTGYNGSNGPREEICNNFDDDCNGLIDEYLTRETSCGVGACAGNTGTETCVSGQWSASTCNILSGAMSEICDGIDNDCDGTTDEDLIRATSCGVGACAGSIGTETCVDGTWSNNTCDPFSGTGIEICNSIDDDCDGAVDEDC